MQIDLDLPAPTVTTLGQAILARARAATELTKGVRRDICRVARSADACGLGLDPTREEIDRWLAKLPSVQARHYALGQVRVAWRWLQQQGVVPTERASRAELIDLPARPGRPTWTAPPGIHQQIDQVVVELVGEGRLRPHCAWAIRMLLWTGRRPSEILWARAADVHVGARALYLPRTKIGAAQQVALEGPALDCAIAAKARAQGRRSKWLFPAPRDPSRATPVSTASSWWGPVMDACEDRGIAVARTDGRRLVLRDLRPIAITEMGRAGVPLPAIAQASGHVELATVQHYLRLGLDDARSAVRALQREKQVEAEQHNGVRIAAIRKEKRMTKAECARSLGITGEAWRQYELAGIDRLSIIRKVAAVLEVDWRSLV